MRFGTVAIIGRSNVGKSTFLNAVLGEQLAVVSARPQTTRERLLGVVELPEAQIAFVDTPGLHRPKSELGRRMNSAALDAARTADIQLLMTDVECLLDVPGAEEAPSAEDLALLTELPTHSPCVLAINKVDRLRNKAKLLPLIEAFAKNREFAAIVPVSLLDPKAAPRLLKELLPFVPAGAKAYRGDTLTDRSSSFFVREYVREQTLILARREVPHAVAVSIERISETDQQLFAEATIHVEKVGQRKILVGRNGENIREIGTRARKRLEQLLGKPVVLKLFVRVTPRWRDSARLLAELGYERSGETKPNPLTRSAAEKVRSETPAPRPPGNRRRRRGRKSKRVA
jgi:GTP-binding protein Era